MRPDPLAGDIDGERTDFDALGRERAPIAPGQRADASEQFAEIERLGEVIVGAGVEPCHSRLHRIPRGEHQHRHVGTRSTQFPAQRQAVLSGQHDVEDDRIIVGLMALVRRRIAICRDVDRMTRFAQPLRDETGGVRLVLDQQYPHATRMLALCAEFRVTRGSGFGVQVRSSGFGTPDSRFQFRCSGFGGSEVGIPVWSERRWDGPPHALSDCTRTHRRSIAMGASRNFELRYFYAT